MTTVKMNKGWWLGVPAVAFVVAWLPYWIWNLTAGAPLSNEWWRVRIVPQGIFDAYIYLHWLGAYVLGNDAANQFSWLGKLLRVLYSTLPNGVTIPELWIVSRWVAIIFSIWIGSWCLTKWTGCTRNQARVYSAVVWVASFLTLSLRPGISSTYWPVVIAGVTFVFIGAERLDQGYWKRGLAWIVAGIMLSSIYPWFFLFSGIWATAILCSRFSKMSMRINLAIVAATSVVTVLISPFIARILMQPNVVAKLETVERNGVVFSRMPFISNTVIVMAVWLFLCGVILCFNRKINSAAMRRLAILFSAWLALFAVWFHTPFTGVFTHNDHFISVVQFLGIVSVLAVWITQSEVDFRINKRIPLVLGLFSSAFFIYILAKPARGSFLKLDVYVIHLTNWFFLAITSWMMVFKSRFMRFSEKPIIFWIAIFSPLLLVSIGSLTTAIIRESPDIVAIKTRVPVIEWISSNVSPGTAMCAEPEIAAFYSAHTGRPVLPGEGPIAYPISYETVLTQLETIAGSLNVADSGNSGSFRFFSVYYLDRACRQFAIQMSVMRKIGVSEEMIDRISGCDEKRITSFQSRIEIAVQKHELNEAAFISTCPYAIVEKGRKDYWNLPKNYKETVLSDGTSIWGKN